ncbi:MAG: protein-L-isoaspartate(D-aspartate) O-methyltransferase [Chloroflexi bacterium]|nr:protein-L-isoaspartate(D-aspartate) O-methyltransferase [Chloroflexota bacterium]
MSFAEDRTALVRALERSGIADRRVLDAMGRVPRELFVPADLRDDAYADHPMPIGEGQTISQPYIVARMTELLDPRPTDHVLEVGGGSGYQAAVLASLVRDVVTVERHEPLARAAAERLRELGYGNVRVVVGDGSEGYGAEAPYDKILIAAAAPEISDKLRAQCAPHGRVVAPLGDRQRQELVVEFGDGRRERYGGVRFVPLRGRAGFTE